jgi:hypothetical protein
VKPYKPHTIYLLFLFLLLTLLIVPTVVAEVKLIDVDAEGTACIFDVDGKIAVVEERDTKEVNGYRIWVKEAHRLNSEARDEDKCEALISVMSGATTQTLDEEKEEPLPAPNAEESEEEEESTQTAKEQKETEDIPPEPLLIAEQPIIQPKLTLKQKIINFFKALFQLN